VVRLKGGDPLIFGRASEEMAALHEAGLEVVVVNGITSGLAAAASGGFSWTDRRCQAHGVLLVTGQCRAGAPGPDWSAIGQLAAGGTTVVIYMGISRCADITAQLRTHLPAHWPAAVVQHASGSGERLLQTTLADLPVLAAHGAIQSPSIIVLGPVVAGVLNAALRGAAPSSVAMDASGACPEHPSWPLLEQSM
jgi:uroporphyrin-III C-methyltransferase